MMFWLGLLLPISFVPGYTGASIATQWAVLSIVLPLGLWVKGPITLSHWLFLLFAVWSVISLFETHTVNSSVFGLWLIFIWALSFHLGTVVKSLVPLWQGLAVGLSISTGVAVAQALDYAPVLTNDPYGYAGLLYNTTLQGICISLVLIALVVHRLWWYMPPLAIGLILSGSRGGFLLLGLALLAHFTRPLVAVGALAIGCATFAATDLADIARLQIWGYTIRGLYFLGHGPGAFAEVFFITPIKGVDQLVYAGFAHNDILQLAYEHGIGAVPFLAIIGLALVRTASPEWPIAFAFATAMLFYFPLYTPITAFIGMVVAGRIAVSRCLVWAHKHRSRSRFVSWAPNQVPIPHLSRREALPLVARTSHTEA